MKTKLKSPLKGICKIQLMDETGKVIQETQDENMVTNAIANVLNPSPLMFAESTSADYENYMFTIMSSLEKLLGGVMLWSEAIPEDVNTIFPPNIEAQVGYAGNNAYTGTNAFRGSFNTIESGEIHNGHRFVWDFPTSAANGTIKCVTLTSGVGGRCGWGGDADSDITRYVGTAISISSSNGSPDYYSAGSLIGQWLTDTFTFARVNGKTLSLIDVEMPINSLKAGSGSIYTNKIKRNYKDCPKTDISMEYTLNSAIPTYFSAEDKLVICTNKGADTFYYLKIDPLTKAIVENKEIIVSGYSFSRAHSYRIYAELDGYLYIIGNKNSTDSLLKVNLSDTSIVEVIAMPAYVFNYLRLFIFQGKLAFSTGYSTSDRDAYYLNSNGEWVKLNCNNFFYYAENAATFCKDIKSPFMLNTISPSNSGCTVFSYLTNAYLATIDNLQTPVNKTASQTMKLTYTLVDIDG